MTNTQNTITTPIGITWTETVLTEATLRHTFDTTVITLVETACDDPEALINTIPAEYRDTVNLPTTTYEVSGVGFYNTSRGPYVQGRHGKSFRTAPEARAYANNWFTKLTGKGWERIA